MAAEFKAGPTLKQAGLKAFFERMKIQTLSESRKLASERKRQTPKRHQACDPYDGWRTNQ
jgi:hypothetical protein